VKDSYPPPCHVIVRSLVTLHTPRSSGAEGVGDGPRLCDSCKDLNQPPFPPGRARRTSNEPTGGDYPRFLRRKFLRDRTESDPGRVNSRIVAVELGASRVGSGPVGKNDAGRSAWGRCRSTNEEAKGTPRAGRAGLGPSRWSFLSPSAMTYSLIGPVDGQSRCPHRTLPPIVDDDFLAMVPPRPRVCWMVSVQVTPAALAHDGELQSRSHPAELHRRDSTILTIGEYWPCHLESQSLVSLHGDRWNEVYSDWAGSRS
jgi:hypothetical protein